MAGGIWTSPVDVGVEGVPTTLLTNIADDLRCLHKGNGHTTVSQISPNSSGHLNVGSDDQYFKVLEPSNYGIRFISTAGRQLGNAINLEISTTTAYQQQTSIYTNASSPPVGYVPIIVNHEQIFGSYTIYLYDVITLFFHGSFWLCRV